MNSTKIHILFNFTDNPWGGGNQFLKAVKNHFIKINVYEEDYKKADIIILNSYNNFEKALKIKLKHPHIKFVHRIDGPIYRYRDDGVYLDKIIFKLNKILSEATIFQSNYTKEASLESGLCLKGQLNKVIINAPNPEIFFRKEKLVFDKKIKLIATSWSGNLKKGFDVYSWLDKNLDFSKYEMTFVGNSPIKFNSIIHKESMDSINLSVELRKNDIFIFPSKIESCSNSLLEALHSGLPSIAYNSTSMPEIINQGGELFDKKEEIPLLLEKIEKNYDSYSNQINLPSIERIGEDYFSFCSLLNKKNSFKKNNLFDCYFAKFYLKSILLYKKIYMKVKSVI